MTESQFPDQCNNSPRAALVYELLLGRIEHDVDLLQKWCTATTEWDIAGSRVYIGPVEIISASKTELEQPVQTLVVDTVLSHGKFGSISGIFEFESMKPLRFCEVFVFKGHSRTSPLERMNSYWVPDASKP